MAVETSSGAEAPAVTEFHQLGLDPRLLRAVAKKGFGAPSRVQAEVLPSALEGRDVVAAARTGSGKTMAYLLPTLHRVLTSGKGKGGWQALILVPTRELCQQVREEVQSVAEHCGSHVLKATALTAEGAAAQRQQLSSVGQVVVATPGRIASLLKSGALPPRVLSRNLEMLVLDEADLLLSFGYEDDVKEIVPHIQRSVQCMLMSATTSEDVKRLQALVLHNPVVLSLLDSLKEGAGDCNGASASTDIEHFRFDCSTSDRLLVTMALLKLGAIKRKVLIFVNSIDTGFQLRLFLERFGIRTALLNAELPLNSRHHILQEFNKGLFDYLIATDNIYGAHKAQAAAEKTRGKGDKRKGPRKDGEFGVTRGVDFRGVSTVLNFDMPDSVEGYVHRVGRTGRAGQKGVALALVTPQTREIAEKVEAALVTDAPAIPTTEDEEEGGGASVAQGLKPFTALTKKAVDALRYRAEDVARSITRSSVKEARAKELRLEMLNSERLKDHFEERPGDLAILKHDKLLHKTQELTHLKHIPQYLRDVEMQKGSSNVGGGKGVLPRRKQMKQKSKQLDPLKALGGLKTTKREEEPTELERRAEGWAKKNAPKNKKMEPILKGNVKKRRKL